MNENEIRNLRWKFIWIAMTSFVFVILIVGILINAANYIVSQREIWWSLKQLTKQQAAIEEIYDETQPFPDAPSLAEVFNPAFQNNTFYILYYDSNGEESMIYTSRNNLYAESIIRSKALEIMQKHEKQGRQDMFYYRKNLDEDNGTLLVIMDSSYAIFTRIRLLYATIAVGMVCVLVALILVICLSGKMIRPEIESSKRQTQFLTNVSHELKTPLAIIQSNAEIEELSKGKSEWTQSTIRQVERMSGLINNLVMITKYRERKDMSHMAAVNISDIIRQTIKDYSHMAEGRGNTMKESIESDVKLVMDESEFRQVTVILIDNAVKYCNPEGEITVSLERLGTGDKKARLTVSNTYAEGKDADCSYFFYRFFRGDSARNIDTGGYGIGLNIAEEICEQYGSRIIVRWNDNKISFICDLS